MADAGIVRNRAKIEATIGNARAYLELQQEGEGFARFCWSFVDGKPQKNAWREPRQIPAETPQSQALSKVLRARGFRFVGPTIVYAWMQACGLVDDHLVGCFRYLTAAKIATRCKKRRAARASSSGSGPGCASNAQPSTQTLIIWSPSRIWSITSVPVMT